MKKALSFPLPQIKSFFIIFFLLVLGASCSTDNEDIESKDTDEPNLPKAAASVQTMEMVIIDLRSSLSSEEYQGTFADQSVKLFKLDDSLLTFMVPQDMVEGVSTLTISGLDLDRRYDVSISKLEGSPEETFNQLLTNVNQEIDDFDGALEKEYVSEFLSKLKDSFNKASASEQLQAAQFYQVNKQVFDDILTGEYRGVDKMSAIALKNDHLKAQSFNLSTLAKFQLAVGTMGVSAVFAAAAPVDPLSKGIAAVVAIVAAKKAYDYHAQLREKELKKLNILMDGIHSDLKQQEQQLEFIHDQSRVLDLDIKHRPINSFDENDSNQNIGVFFSAFNSFKGLVQKLNGTIEYLNENLFVNEIDILETPVLEERSPTTGSINSEIYQAMKFSIAGDKIQISEINYEDGLNIKLSIDDVENVDEDYVETQLNYSYSDDFNDFGGSFPIKVKKEEESDPNLTIFNHDGSALPSLLELINNTPKAMKLVDDQGNDLEAFDISKLSIQNISNSEVKIHAQKNGVFGGGEGGHYFEIIALTDLEETQTSFDVYYGGAKIRTLQAVIKQPVYKVVNPDGSALDGNIVFTNNQSRDLTLRNENGEAMPSFNFSLLSIGNISDNEVSLNLKQRIGNDIFGILPSTELEEATFSFDIFYDGKILQTVDATINSPKYGLVLNGKLHELSNAYVEYNYQGEGTEELPASVYIHHVMITSSEIDYENQSEYPGGGSMLFFPLVSNKSDHIPDGQYEFNPYVLSEYDVFKPFYTAGIGFFTEQNDYTLGWKTAPTNDEREFVVLDPGYIEVVNEGNEVLFIFNLYEENEKVAGKFKGQLVPTNFDFTDD